MDYIPDSRISIQVGLSGYSFQIEDKGSVHSSGWQGAERIFTTKEFQQRYDRVDISLFTPKFTLIPKQFFNPLSARQALSEVVPLNDSDMVDHIDVEEYNAVLVYSNSIGESLSKVISQTVMDQAGERFPILPEAYYLLKSLKVCTEYNKIIASYMDGYLYLVLAQGKCLLLCNVFPAADFTTAEYFIFLALNSLQLNPEVSTITFRTPLTNEQEMSLYRYFRAVEVI